MDTDSTDDAAPERDLSDHLGFARALRRHVGHAAGASDLEDMPWIAWGLMTPEQRAAFREHPDVLAIEDAVGGGSPAA